jgi:DNA-binding transcriptional LysR family regulator
MDLRSLRCFLAVAEELHFGRAALKLHMSQPPLSQQIRRLEETLGVQLFDRNRRSVKLTEAGATLLREGRGIIAQIEKATEVVRHSKAAATEHVRIGFVSAAVVAGVGDLLQALNMNGSTFSTIWTEIGSAEQVEALLEKRIDLGFAHTPLNYGPIRTLPLFHKPFMIALPATHPAASRQTIRLRELQDETFLVGNRDGSPGYYDQMAAVCREAGFVPRIMQQGRHVFAVLGLVRMGLGVALVPSSFSAVAMPGLVLRDIEGPNRDVELSVLWNPQNETSAVARILAMFRSGIPEDHLYKSALS